MSRGCEWSNGHTASGKLALSDLPFPESEFRRIDIFWIFMGRIGGKTRRVSRRGTYFEAPSYIKTPEVKVGHNGREPPDLLLA